MAARALPPLCLGDSGTAEYDMYDATVVVAAAADAVAASAAPSVDPAVGTGVVAAAAPSDSVDPAVGAGGVAAAAPPVDPAVGAGGESFSPRMIL